MAIYRPPRPRWRAVALGVLAGTLLGGAIGFALGNPNEPDLDAAVGTVRASLARAAGSLEVAAIEYDEAVEDGEVIAEAEYDGALAAVASAEDAYTKVRSALAGLVPDRATEIDAAFDELRAAMTAKEMPNRVATLAMALEELLKE